MRSPVISATAEKGIGATGLGREKGSNVEAACVKAAA